MRGDLSTLEDWTSVLHLATKYCFDGYRELAVARLSQLGTAVDHIVLARQYDIPEWLEEASFHLCRREEALSLEEGTRLGMKDVIVLAELRQRIRAHVWGYTLDESAIKHSVRDSLRANTR